MSTDFSPQKVRLRQLTLTSYRNYQHLLLSVEDAPLVLSGPNGAGKTNILEAISLLSPGRGLRRAAYSAMVHHAAASSSQYCEFAVHVRLDNAVNGKVAIGTGSVRTPSGLHAQKQGFGASAKASEGDLLNANRARRVRINGEPQSVDSLLEFCRVIWLTPTMDGLFTGSPSERRRFLDRMVLAIEPRHGRAVADYERIMRSRNKLLAQDKYDTSWLDALERQMAGLGVAIAAARWQLVEQLSILSVREQQMIFPAAILELDGSLEQRLQQGGNALDVEEEFYALLVKSRGTDRINGRTMVGPHRSDLKIIHAQKAIAASLASTGEQKALLAGLVLAHARLTAFLSGLTPLLLLDEITAHLDQMRVRTLFELIDDMGAQAFLTGTERALFKPLEGRGQFVSILNNEAITATSSERT